MKKAVHLSYKHNAQDTRIFYKEALALKKSGYDVTVIANHPCNETIDGIKIISLNNKLLLKYDFISILTLGFLALKEESDVYHFHDPQLIPIALLLKALTTAEVFYDVHEDYPKKVGKRIEGFNWLPFSSFFSSIFKKIVSLLEGFVGKVFDQVIVALEEIQEHFGLGDITVIHNYAIISDLSDLPKTNIQAPQQSTNLVYAGGISRFRGVHKIVDSLPLIKQPSFVFKLLGDINSDSYEKRIRSSEGFSKVDYLGWKKFPEVISQLESSDIGIVTYDPMFSYQPNLPVKLLEYMAAGLPVIACDYPIWREIISKYECGLLLESLDPEEIAEKITYLINNSKEAVRMGQRGREAVLKKFNWENEAKKLIAIYDELGKSE